MCHGDVPFGTLNARNGAFVVPSQGRTVFARHNGIASGKRYQEVYYMLELEQYKYELSRLKETIKEIEVSL